MIDATPALRLYAAWRARQIREPAPPGQAALLRRLVARAAATRFGRDHGFDRIRSVADFQARVPLRRYEAFWRDYWQPAFPRLTDCSWPGLIPYFAVTSGTSAGSSKHIPVSHAMVAANRRAALDLLAFHARNRPASRILGGRSFMLGGSTDLVTLAPGVQAGDLSGIAAAEVPRWARNRLFPSRDLALIADWDAKIAAIGPRSLTADIRAIGGTPSWLLLFLDRLAQAAGRSQHLAELYPRLELLVHGGVDFAPYRRRFEALLEGSHAELREVYPASEGFVAIADRGPGDGLRILADNGLFFEFVPVEDLDAARPTRHWLADAGTGINYALVLSSCAGLWAYVLGDTVRLLSRDPPRLVVTGRVSYMLSAFGEHLIAEEIEAAMAEAAEAAGTTVADHAAGALYPSGPGELGRHVFVVEFASGAVDPARFAERLDQALAARNDDYRAHRAGLAAPAVLAMPPGGFARWMRRRGKLGGQHKVPRVITDPALLDDLSRFAQGHGAADA